MDVATGVDSHKASFTAAVVDALGRVLDVETFRNDARGFKGHWWRGSGASRTARPAWRARSATAQR
ncbi:MAG: hypothetical protein ACRDKT_04855 [Actinomycetota bacterium]